MKKVRCEVRNRPWYIQALKSSPMKFNPEFTGEKSSVRLCLKDAARLYPDLSVQPVAVSFLRPDALHLPHVQRTQRGVPSLSSN